MIISKQCLDLSHGYKGDITEDYFKPLTEVYLPHWWLFRELIRAGNGKYLKDSSNSDAPDSSKDLLLKLAYVGHTVYLSATAAIQFATQASASWPRGQHAIGIQNARRYMKAYCESLYSLAGGVANTYAILFRNHDFSNGNVMIGSARHQALASSDQQEKSIGDVLNKLEQYLLMRHHEVHFWVQITALMPIPNSNEVCLGIHEDFQKASLPNYGSTAVLPTPFATAWKTTLPEIFNLTNSAYTMYCDRVDTWLAIRNEHIDYSDFSTHGGAKPVPKPRTFSGGDPLLWAW